MQYLALIYTEDDASPSPGDDGFDAYMQGYYSATETYKSAGIMMGGEALLPTSTATSVRVRDGKTETMDGPFAETKEYLGGYYVIDVPDLDAAITYAEMSPSAAFGTIEVRAMMDYNPAG